MKPIKLLLVIVAIFMMNNTYAVQYKFVAMDNSKYTKMCVLAGNNEQKALKTTFRNQSKGFGGSQKIVANNTLCNGMVIANFAQKYHANLTYDYLKKYTNKRNLNNEMEVTIKDIAARTTKNKSMEEIILVYVGR